MVVILSMKNVTKSSVVRDYAGGRRWAKERGKVFEKCPIIRRIVHLLGSKDGTIDHRGERDRRARVSIDYTKN